MGDNFLKQQVRNFRKGRDLARRDWMQPRLIERPELVKTVFTLQPLENQQYHAGETLTAIIDSPEGPVWVVREHRKVGTVDGDSSKALKDVLGAPDCANVALIRVSDVGGLSGVATAVIVPFAGM